MRLHWKQEAACALLLVALGIGVDMHGETASKQALITYPAPAGEKLSADYAVTVRGKAVAVYRCRVSAMPFNQVWPGYQRPLDQTELASFACWDMSGAAAVEVASKRPVRTVGVRPGSLGIKPPEKGAPKPGDANVRYFPPGGRRGGAADRLLERSHRRRGHARPGRMVL